MLKLQPSEIFHFSMDDSDLTPKDKRQFLSHDNVSYNVSVMGHISESEV